MRVPFLLILTPLIITLLLPGLQGKTGAITIFVVSASGTPVANAAVHFRAERETQSRSTCTTDAQGRCLLVIADAPTDASGLVRGNLYIGESSRPVLWPGGDLAITITLTRSGLIRPGADFINGSPLSLTVTSTPAISVGILATPRVGPTAPAVPRSVTLTSTPPAALNRLHGTPPTAPAPMPWQQFAILLVTALFGGVGMWRYRRRRAKGRAL
jgi:hypothetical protein